LRVELRRGRKLIRIMKRETFISMIITTVDIILDNADNSLTCGRAS
jgi:hypothetical protein